jgi:hypothetical protein
MSFTYENALEYLKKGGTIRVAKRPFMMRRLHEGRLELLDDVHPKWAVKEGVNLNAIAQITDYYEPVQVTFFDSYLEERMANPDFAKAYTEEMVKLLTENSPSEVTITFTAAEARKLSGKTQSTSPVDKEVSSILTSIKAAAEEGSVAYIHHVDSASTDEVAQTLTSLGYTVEHLILMPEGSVCLHITWGTDGQ